MIDTICTKKDQLDHGSYRLGHGPEIMLLIGSCRAVPYLNYFDYLSHNNRFTVHFIDPFNWHWDVQDNLIADYEAKINSLECDPRLLDLFKSADWYVHEYYEHYGMFNSSKDQPKNIYQFGLNPKHDITIPNFRDKFILFQDVVRFNQEIREQALKQKPLSHELQEQIRLIGLNNVDKFWEICHKSDFPEMGSIFLDNWRKVRYFQTMNHVSNQFTMAIFRLLNDKHLHLDAPQNFWNKAMSEDLYRTPCTPVTQYDVDNYNLHWGCAIEQLQIP